MILDIGFKKYWRRFLLIFLMWGIGAGTVILFIYQIIRNIWKKL